MRTSQCYALTARMSVSGMKSDNSIETGITPDMRTTTKWPVEHVYTRKSRIRVYSRLASKNKPNERPVKYGVFIRRRKRRINEDFGIPKLEDDDNHDITDTQHKTE